MLSRIQNSGKMQFRKMKIKEMSNIVILRDHTHSQMIHTMRMRRWYPLHWGLQHHRNHWIQERPQHRRSKIKNENHQRVEKDRDSNFFRVKCPLHHWLRMQCLGWLYSRKWSWYKVLLFWRRNLRTSLILSVTESINTTRKHHCFCIWCMLSSTLYTLIHEEHYQ